MGSATSKHDFKEGEARCLEIHSTNQPLCFGSLRVLRVSPHLLAVYDAAIDVIFFPEEGVRQDQPTVLLVSRVGFVQPDVHLLNELP